MTEEVFDKALDANPLDWSTRSVYSDWLRDNGRTREADLQRYLTLYQKSPLHTRTFFSQCNSHSGWIWSRKRLASDISDPDIRKSLKDGIHTGLPDSLTRIGFSLLDSADVIYHLTWGLRGSNQEKNNLECYLWLSWDTRKDAEMALLEAIEKHDPSLFVFPESQLAAVGS